jgi:hypothetical protein
MQRKPQQQTLSIRISDTLRQYLEHVKLVTNNGGHGESASMSDIAKMLLESARNDHLDHRLEVAEIQQSATEALSNIRRKWEQSHGLSQAEWVLIARYVQVGCEELSADPELPSSESFAQVLAAFLAVRALRCDRGIELDRYYLGNLGAATRTSERRLDPDVVPNLTENLIRELRLTARAPKPAFAGRNLYAALRDETLPGIVPINSALSPYLTTLFRLAARGHWLQERRPLSMTPCVHTGFSRTCRHLQCDGQELSIRVMEAGDLQISVSFPRKGVTYPLVRYPRIREFSLMLERLETEGRCRGHEFSGHARAITAGQPVNFFCRQRRSGIEVAFSREEWQALRGLFGEALVLPEVQPVLEELSLVYGEI